VLFFYALCKNYCRVAWSQGASVGVAKLEGSTVTETKGSGARSLPNIRSRNFQDGIRDQEYLVAILRDYVWSIV
jgi:hypothetical protein